MPEEPQMGRDREVQPPVLQMQTIISRELRELAQS